jgi:hypothetical protein
MKQGARMATKPASSLNPAFFLQLFLGVFFLTLGIIGLGNYDSGMSKVARFFGRNDALRIIMAVVELVMGVVFVLGLVLSVPSGMTKLLTWVLAALWILYIVINFFLDKTFLEPNLLVWLFNISWHAVILVAIWAVGERYI